MDLNPIEEARAFVMSQVQDPALASETLPTAAKHKVRSTNIWLSKFRRVGDLAGYLARFDSGTGDPLYLEMKQHGLLTFEDIRDGFFSQFSAWLGDKTRPSDFIIGRKYNAHEILIFANVYDTRSGGMFVLESGIKPSAVLIKATLEAGAYQNTWLEKPKRLKYYLKAREGEFGEHFKPNAAVLGNPGLPILTFVRQKEGHEFTYYGVFRYQTIHTEDDGKKWFELSLAAEQPEQVVADGALINENLGRQVRESKEGSREARLTRLKGAAKLPQKIVQTSTAFIRNPDVIAEVLFLANGACGGCNKDAPFKRASDGSPYLEVHHRVPLADGGEDTVANAIALCPNCHRQRHFGA